jgi:peptidoglycan-associated lipoprotein
MKSNIAVLIVVASALALGGCGVFGKKSSSAGGAGADTGEGGSTSGLGGEQAPPPVRIGDDAVGGRYGATGGAGGPGNVVFFEFDSSELSPAGRDVVNAQARFLVANPSARVRLEGHTDERGTREYNVGLGERRASTVMQALISAGVAPSQMTLISYGEERPVSTLSDETGWAQNRRVEIVR